MVSPPGCWTDLRPATSFSPRLLPHHPTPTLCVFWVYKVFIVNNINMIYSTPAICLLIYRVGSTVQESCFPSVFVAAPHGQKTPEGSSAFPPTCFSNAFLSKKKKKSELPLWSSKTKTKTKNQTNNLAAPQNDLDRSRSSLLLVFSVCCWFSRAVVGKKKKSPWEEASCWLLASVLLLLLLFNSWLLT